MCALPYALWCVVNKYYDFLNLFVDKGARQGARVEVCPCRLLPRGLECTKFLDVSILLILPKNNET